MKKRDRDSGWVEIDTVVLCRTLHDGSTTCQPLAEPTRVSYGDRAGALTRLERFLEKHLAASSTRVVARYGLPEGIELAHVDVELARTHVPDRLRTTMAVRFPCVLLPQRRGGDSPVHDAWVMVPALDHTFFLPRGEDLVEATRSEVARLVEARGPWSRETLHLLPAAREELVPLTVLLAHDGEGLAGKARSLEKKKLAQYRRQQALDVLHTACLPLHEHRAVRSARPHVGHEEPLAELTRLLTAPVRTSVLLVGDEGAGKSALMHACFSQQRGSFSGGVFATSAAQLVAGMSGFGEWQQRVTAVAEAAEQLDAVLYFENLAELFGERPDRGGVDVAGVLRPFVVNGRIRLVGELRQQTLDAATRHQPALTAAMSRVRIPEMGVAATRRVLAAHVAGWAKVRGPGLDEAAVEPIIELAERYMPYRAFPGKAVRFAEELLASAGETDVVGTERVYEAFSLASGIPSLLLRPDRALRVDRVVAALRRRVIGQHDAVRRVAEALSVVKARMQPEGKPLCTLLFIGPTGVGKTEVARALSAFLFGSEERMARFDMSEYADVLAAERLIRGTERDSGALTSKVREQPFCVLLLDEIEKAHPAVFDLLLQVLGEGRLTDARGRTTFFHNAIIVMTSNLGAVDKRAPVGLRAAEPDARQHYMRAVHEAFRPELVGRLDRVVVFEALTRKELDEVTAIAIDRLGDRRGLTEYGVTLDVSEGARRALSRGGYDERYGVRALRRHIDDALIVPIARSLAKLGAAARGCMVWVGTKEDGSCGTENNKNRVARDRVGELTIELYRRPAASGKRALSGLDAVAEVRREIDRLMDREEVRGVFEHFELLRAQLATAGAARTTTGATQLRREEIELLQREHHRAREAIESIGTLREDLTATEQLCLTALFEGESVSEWADEATGILGLAQGAIARLILAPKTERDEVTVVLLSPEGGQALTLWLEPLMDLAAQRGWQLTFLERSDVKEKTKGLRPFGPERDAKWARANVLGSHVPLLVMQARGRDAGLWLALEAGRHRILGLGNDARPKHFEVRLAAMHVELTEAQWWDTSLRRNMTVPRAGVTVARERAKKGNVVDVHGAREVDVDAADYWTRFEEIALAHLLFHHDAGRADELYRGVLTALTDSEEDGG